MPDINAKRSHVRIAAAILAALVVVAAVFTYLSYTAAFTSTDTVTVLSPRAGLVMEDKAKDAKLTLAIRSGELRYIPSNAIVRIAGTTIFGAKGVEFLPPKDPD